MLHLNWKIWQNQKGGNEMILTKGTHFIKASVKHHFICCRLIPLLAASCGNYVTLEK